MTLQRGRIFGQVLFKRRVTEQEVGPAGQKQSGAGAGKRFRVLFRIIEQDQDRPSKINFFVQENFLTENVCIGISLKCHKKKHLNFFVKLCQFFLFGVQKYTFLHRFLKILRRRTSAFPELLEALDQELFQNNVKVI